MTHYFSAPDLNARIKTAKHLKTPRLGKYRVQMGID